MYVLFPVCDCVYNYLYIVFLKKHKIELAFQIHLKFVEHEKKSVSFSGYRIMLFIGLKFG